MYTKNEISRSFNRAIMINQRLASGNNQLTEAEALSMPLPTSMTGFQAWQVIVGMLENGPEWYQSPAVEEVI